jgi:hypothetical protein
MIRRRKPSLFEVVSKAPQVQYPARPLGWFSRRPAKGPQRPFVPLVAEALTEAEAQAEMAARQETQQHRRQAKEAKRAAKLAKKEAARASRHTAAAAAEKAASVVPPAGHSVRFAEGRLVVSFNTVVSLVTAGAICVLMLSAYSLGRWSLAGKSGAAGGGAVPAAAVRNQADFSTTPLLPSLTRSAERAQTRNAAPPNADLSQLLQKPPARQEPSAAANSPGKAVADEPREEGAAESLNYLQIESFLITRDRSGDMVAQDLDGVRRFLSERGVKTTARRHSNGYVLFSEQGFPPQKESARQREAFRKKIEALGQEYRRSGGAYEFKGCDFVSFQKTRAGRPV